MTVFSRAGHPVVVGHRGVRRPELVENTPAAFAAASAEGATWVELDARRSADGVAVVYHDGCTPDGIAVVQRTAGELAASGIHALAGVLAGLPPGLGVNIEVKNLPGEPDYDPEDTFVEVVAEVVGATAGARPLLMSSFNPLTVGALVAALPAVPAGLIHYEGIAVEAAVELALEFGAVALASRLGAEGLDATGIGQAHDAGLEVMAWTVNDVGVARDLAEAAVDAICTDDPATLRAALEA